MARYNIDMAQMAKIAQAQKIAIQKTALNIDAKIIRENVVPMDEGDLQLSSKVEMEGNMAHLSWGAGAITPQGQGQPTTDLPYARKQYFDTSLKHDKGPHAGTAKARWADDYLQNGSQFKYVQQMYRTHFMKEFHKMGGTTSRDNQNPVQPTNPTPSPNNNQTP